MLTSETANISNEYSEIARFFDKLKQSQSEELKLTPYIFYHSDADGLCSAALMLAYLRAELGIQNVKLQCVDVSDVQSVVVFSPTIFLDLAILPRQIENPQKQPILIIDHHIIPENVVVQKHDILSEKLDVVVQKHDILSEKLDAIAPESNLSSEELDVVAQKSNILSEKLNAVEEINAIYINPRATDPEAYKPASFVVYSLLERFEAVKRRAFIAAAGVIGDKGDANNEECSRFVERFDIADVAEILDSQVESAEILDSRVEPAKILDSRAEITKLSEVITGVFAFNKKDLNFNATMTSLIDFLLEQTSASDFLAKPSEFLEQAAEFQKNLEETICNAKIEELNAVALLIQIDSKLCNPSIISTILADKYSDRTVFVINKAHLQSQNIKISCRSKLIECNLLMRQITSQIPNSNGGGHERAAGLLIPTKYFQKFIDIVRNKTQTATE